MVEAMPRRDERKWYRFDAPETRLTMSQAIRSVFRLMKMRPDLEFKVSERTGPTRQEGVIFYRRK